MSAVKAVRALLAASAPVIAICPAVRIMAGIVPQGTAMPSLSIMHVSTVPISHVDAQAEFNVVTSRVQVTIMASSYAGVKPLLDAVRKACNYQRGTIAGVDVASILRDTVGPDFSNDDASVYYQTIDFKVTFHEPN
jgi:hypothetical protein